MSTDAERFRAAVFYARRNAQGYRRKHIWLQPFFVARLHKLAPYYGSIEAAVEAAILALEPPAEDGLPD